MPRHFGKSPPACPGHHLLRPGAPGSGPVHRARLAPGRPGRGAEHQEPRRGPDQGRQQAPGQAPARLDRHPGRESPDGPVVHLQLHKPRLPGHPGPLPQPFRTPRPARQRSGADRDPQAPRGALHPAPGQDDKAIIRDLPDKLEAIQYCNLSREQAALYEGVVREVERELEGKEGIARQG